LRLVETLARDKPSTADTPPIHHLVLFLKKQYAAAARITVWF
jgi:hypothetical protein